MTGSSATTSTRVTVVEVGPRDGLQNEAVLLSTDAKLSYIARLIEAGLTRIEVTSFVHPKLVPQMADAEALMARAPRPPGVSYIGLVLNDRGLERAVAAGVDEANIVLVASETFSRKNQGMGVEDALASFDRTASGARAAGLRVTATIGASFGCPFEGEVSVDQVLSIVRRVAASGAQEIALADTIGVGVPQDVHRLLSAVRGVTDLPLRCHFHNTRNTGYANAIAAVEDGVSALDASSGGIGGCPFAPNATGNIATEDLSYLLSRSGVGTGLSFPALIEAADYVGGQLGGQLPALLGRAGSFPESVVSEP